MFHSPWALWLLLLLPLIGWRIFRKRNDQLAMEFSSIAFAKSLRPTFRQKLMWLPRALLLVALGLIILAMARPRAGQQRTIVSTDGIAIEMVVDRSPSMNAMDFAIDEQEVDRLTAVKHVATRFVNGEASADDTLPGRASDLIGLTCFSGYADNISPLTLDHTFLLSKLMETEIVSIRNDGGTAIGDAIASAVEKLKSLDKRQRKQVASKIVILLTDGENNAGTLEPLAAAELAQTMGIKVYTIGVGTDQGEAKMPVENPITGRRFYQLVPVSIDEETLTQVAESTGGKYFRATDTDSLLNIYREIDSLEKTNVETNTISDYRELAVEAFRPERWPLLRIPPILLMALGALLIKWILETTWLRELGGC